MGDKLNSHLLDFGLQTANAAAGAGMGLLLQKGQDKRQLKQQKKLNALQIEGNKQMMDYGYGKQMQMWQDTNYGAQMEQLTKAGLNPGMIYGMSGGGATTTGSPQGNITGGHAPTGGGEAISMAQTAAGLGLMRAQRENIEADTANKKATTTKTAGIDTQLGETQIQSLTQGIQNSKAVQKLNEVQTQLAQIETQVKGKTIQEQQDIISRTASKMIEEVDILHQQLLLDRQTRDMKVSLLGVQIANEIIKIGVQQTHIQVQQAQIQKWQTEISQAWSNLDRQERELAVKAIETDIHQKYPGLWNVIGRMINDTGNKIGEILGEKPPKTATDAIKKQ